MVVEKYEWLWRGMNGGGEVWMVVENYGWLWRSMNGCGEV